jgi:hypothetical protein
MGHALPREEHRNIRTPRGPPRLRATVLVVFLTAIAMTLGSLKLSAVPFAWIGAVWAIVAFHGAARVASSLGKAFLVNFGVALATLAVYELYLYVGERETERNQPRYSQKHTVPHAVLGVVPAKDTVTRATRYHGERLDYDVTYTIDARGLRIAPSTLSDEGGSCVLFFGCSFTFGEGLNDDEALPYQVGVKTAGKYTVLNFGFSGYGAHQMLAMLEQGYLEQIVRCTPRYAIYTSVPDHVRRSAGVSRYPFGPRYVLSPDGQLKMHGLINPSRTGPVVEGSRLLYQLAKSQIYRAISARGTIDDQDTRLYLQIVMASAKLLRERYPQASFHVLLWDDPYGETDLYLKVKRGLIDGALPVHLVSDILPNYRSDRMRYRLSPDDRHPSALANERLAEWLQGNVLRE